MYYYIPHMITIPHQHSVELAPSGRTSKNNLGSDQGSTPCPFTCTKLNTHLDHLYWCAWVSLGPHSDPVPCGLLLPALMISNKVDEVSEVFYCSGAYLSYLRKSLSQPITEVVQLLAPIFSCPKYIFNI